MRLWLVRPIDCSQETKNPWNPWYDSCFGMVIRAKTADDARYIAAHDEVYDFADDGKVNGYGSEGAEPWLDPKLTSCVELTLNGDDDGDGIIIRDFHSA